MLSLLPEQENEEQDKEGWKQCGIIECETLQGHGGLLCGVHDAVFHFLRQRGYDIRFGT